MTCPSIRPSIIDASVLPPLEAQWLQVRRKNTVQPLQQLLGRLNIAGFDATTYINNLANNISALPNIGIAASGGGYRALMNGAGALAAFDNRTPNSMNTGQLGGLLQSATYISGLSGGSWLVGSIYTNNFTSVQAIIDSHSQLWDFSSSILSGPSAGLPLLGTTEYYQQLYDVVAGKKNAYYNISLTDYWGRGLSYQLVNAPKGGPAFTISSIANDPEFSAGNAPMPIIISGMFSDSTALYLDRL